jgi:flagellar hook assembly protein FlgD
VQGANFTRHIVTSIAVVGNERSITTDAQPTNNLEGFGIYPNPSDGEAKIYFEIKEKGIHTLNIYDLTGRKVYSQNLSDLETGKHQVSWQADASLKNGIYIYELESNGKKISKKMILNR